MTSPEKIPTVPDENQLAWYFDQNRCTGCKTCVIGCKSELNTAPQPQGRETEPALNYRWVITQESGTYPNPKRVFYSASCNHCKSPACILSCPVDAISKRDTDGIVLIDQDKCIGCKYCVWACPYGAPRYNSATKKVEKCTFCVHRIDAENGLKPACVTTCVGKALQYDTLANVKKKAVADTKIDGFADPRLTTPNIRFKPQ